MKFIAASGSNFRKGRGTNSIKMIVIHVMEGTMSGTQSWFQNPHARVSAHYLVDKTGAVVQMVKDDDTAYHCIGVNSHSIGIEHEGFVAQTTDFTDAMLQASATLVKNLCQKHSIPMDRKHIVGHSEVPANDHNDPGPHWDWNKYIALVTA